MDEEINKLLYGIEPDYSIPFEEILDSIPTVDMIYDKKVGAYRRADGLPDIEWF
jgi:hypothetical protein